MGSSSSRTRANAQWHSSFPPKALVDKGESGVVDIVKWLRNNIPDLKPPDASLTFREKKLARMSAVEYLNARRDGLVTCEEYAKALVKRMEYYKYMNQFMYWDNMPQQTAYIVKQAMELDAKAARDGIEAIAPFYGLPVPVKGTMATTDFPSSAGVGVLHDCYAKKDAAAITLLRDGHAVIMAKTNVPEFAASWTTANYASGRCLNPFDHALITGGSSGGSASAVASYMAPLAFTEDTAGSTRIPAVQCHNFGFDPSRNHYPNAGNPGITFFNDQIGLNARSFEDILAFDAALLGTHQEHSVKAMQLPEPAAVRVGLPRYPWVDFYIPSGGCNTFELPTSMKVVDVVENKYEEVKAALASGGVQLIQEEWQQVKASHSEGMENALADYLFGRKCNGLPADNLICLHGFSGQIAEWVYSYLGVPVSNHEIIHDMKSLGTGHSPSFIVGASGASDESNFRRFAASLPEFVRLWNSYFDTHEVDVIMVPMMFSEPVTYVDAIDDTCKVKVKRDGEWVVDSVKLMAAFAIHTMVGKCIPIPRLVVPTGLDANGKPSGMMFMGRAAPLDRMFEDDFARTYDLDFLYTMKPLVELIQNTTGLCRADAPLVADLFD